MFYPVGDSAVCFQFEDSAEVGKRIQEACAKLRENPISYVTEWVPGLTTITFLYVPEKISYTDLCAQIEERFTDLGNAIHKTRQRTVCIPICYGGDYGPDLAQVAQKHGLTEEEVIHIHSSVTYTVNLLGFIPGFPYLGGTPSCIATPRLSSPRLNVPQGSVGIAGEMTGIYPSDISGGWNLIGRTPLQMFSIHRLSPFLLEVGDSVSFQRIDTHQFREWRDEDAMCGSKL